MNIILIFVFVLVYVVIVSEEKEVENIHQNELNVKQLVSLYGYPIETHHVVTEDGYILELHRIPYGISNMHSTDHKPAVLIVHGLYSSSVDWVTFGPSRSLPLILADNNYDVWLCNNRGTTWSEKHIKLDSSTDSNEYWNFRQEPFQEIANFDIPASIDYILSKTNQKKLYYIGHSEGTVDYFAMLSDRPDYNNKIRLMVGLAPPESVRENQLVLITMLYSLIDENRKSNGNKDLYFGVLQHSGAVSKLLKLLCVDKPLLSSNELCALIYFAVGGYSPTQLNTTELPRIFKSIPSGGSNKQYLHLKQLKPDDFHKYNYGKIINRQIYGQEIPPYYNISKVTTPVALYSADRDTFFSSKQYFTKHLPYVVSSKIILNFAHLDFLWGIDVVTLVYNDILALMKKY